MFCKNCGNELKEDSRFCDGCGMELHKASQQANPQAIGEPQVKQQQQTTQHQPLITQVNVNSSISLLQFIDDYIKKQSIYVTAIDFIKGVKPLNFRIWSGFIIGVILGIPTSGVGFIFGFPLAWYFSGLVVGLRKLYKMNTKKIPFDGQIDTENLTVFLKNNLTSLPFSNWRTGVPSFFGIKDESVEVIACDFEGKTIHQIIFPAYSECDNNLNWYKISCLRTTTKSYWQHAGMHSTALMYKNEYKTQPILQAAVEYYLTYVNI